jgi:hypothetical protein
MVWAARDLPLAAHSFLEFSYFGLLSVTVIQGPSVKAVHMFHL